MVVPNDMLLFYWLSQNAPGKTAAQRLNWLQDIAGFDPMGKSAVPFQEAPAPTVYNPMDVYGTDEKLRAAFDLVQNQHYDPFAAAQEVGIGSEADAMGNTDPRFKILTSWAETNVANQARLAQWQQEQNAARQKYEASQPLTMKDLTGTTAYDVLSQAAGQPLTAKDLVSAYARNKMAGGKQINVPIRGMMAAPNTGAFGSDPVLAKMIQGRLENVAGRRLEQAKQKFVPTERGKNLLDLMQIYGALGA